MGNNPFLLVVCVFIVAFLGLMIIPFPIFFVLCCLIGLAYGWHREGQRIQYEQQMIEEEEEAEHNPHHSGDKDIRNRRRPRNRGF
ncbi:hypothetical protein BH753_gp039 [Bacillus phage Shbh1]|uniref:Uncharacterized protein n=1 Tax=Bacillus phage Shbh1 TaxID=1796992 RepID=A0A142F164_9CAUD|nr:hypothetical protein BH753_gp039 [Bacillus phage Shbh1]AMQ66521.1 hypothetical protein [Bacillus phage Shbh1]